MINLLQKSLDRRRIVQGGVAAGAAMAFNPFSGLVSAQEAEDLPTDASDMDALIAGAQKENKIVSYGMPDYWANLGEMWETFMAKYDIAEHEDADLSSAQEIAKFLAEAENPIGDIGDIGIQFAPTAIQLGVLRAVQERHLGPDPRLGEASRWSLGRPVLRQPGLPGQHRSRRSRSPLVRGSAQARLR